MRSFMFAKKVLFPLLCASLLGLVACGDEESNHSNSNPVGPSGPTSSEIQPDVPPTSAENPVPESTASTPSSDSPSSNTPVTPPSGDYAALAPSANIAFPIALYGSWKGAHVASLEDDAATYPSLAANYSDVFTAEFRPASRVIWASQSSGTYKTRCTVSDATNFQMKSRACTVSEGIGYGMLLSFFSNDESTFNGFWNYNRAFRAYKGSDNLMPWIVQSFSYTILDRSSATDADLDIATSLILMYYKSKNEAYKADALAIINDLWDQEVDPSTKLLLSGNTAMWNGKNGEIVLNLSYFSPVALRLFAMVDPSHDWNGVLDAMYTYMAKVQDGGTGVFPDWSNTAGVAVAPPNKSAPNTYFLFDKESVRIPWRISWDYYWFQDSRAEAILKKLNKFISDKSSGDVKSDALSTSYSWNLSVGADKKSNTSTVSGMWLGLWCATGIAGNSTWLDACTTEFNTRQLANNTSSYYSDILLLMYSHLLNGLFLKPF